MQEVEKVLEGASYICYEERECQRMLQKVHVANHCCCLGLPTSLGRAIECGKGVSSLAHFFESCVVSVRGYAACEIILLQRQCLQRVLRHWLRASACARFSGPWFFLFCSLERYPSFSGSILLSFLIHID